MKKAVNFVWHAFYMCLSLLLYYLFRVVKEARNPLNTFPLIIIPPSRTHIYGRGAINMSRRFAVQASLVLILPGLVTF